MYDQREATGGCEAASSITSSSLAAISSATTTATGSSSIGSGVNSSTPTTISIQQTVKTTATSGALSAGIFLSSPIPSTSVLHASKSSGASSVSGSQAALACAGSSGASGNYHNSGGNCAKESATICGLQGGSLGVGTAIVGCSGNALTASTAAGGGGGSIGAGVFGDRLARPPEPAPIARSASESGIRKRSLTLSLNLSNVVQLKVRTQIGLFILTIGQKYLQIFGYWHGS